MVTHGHVLLTKFLVGVVRRYCSQALRVPSIGDGGGNGWGCKEAKKSVPLYKDLEIYMGEAVG